MKNYLIALAGPETIELREKEAPVPKANEILVKNEYSCVSAGTERANLLDMPNTVHQFNRAFGYNSVGKVVAVGADVTKFKVGDRVLCAWCGGHRLYSLCRETALTYVPEGIDPKDAAVVMISGFGLEGARRTRLEIGESGLVVGCGLLGLAAIQSFKLMGGVPVIALDFNEDRLALAKKLGADYTFRPDTENLREKVLGITDGQGVNCAVEVTGSAKALVTTLTLMAKRGRVSLTGCTRVSDTPIDFYQLVHRPGIELLGGHTSARPTNDNAPGCWTIHNDHTTLLKLIKAGRYNAAAMHSELVNPADCLAVYDRLAKDPNPPIGVLFDWSLIDKGE